MKLIVRSALLCLLLLCGSAFAAILPGTIPFTQGQLTNPTAGAIVADTGALAANGVNVIVIVTATVATHFVIEWRNAANTANVWAQSVAIPANETRVINLPVGIPFNANERLRVTIFALIVGLAQGSIIIH